MSLFVPIVFSKTGHADRTIYSQTDAVYYASEGWTSPDWNGGLATNEVVREDRLGLVLEGYLTRDEADRTYARSGSGTGSPSGPPVADWAAGVAYPRLSLVLNAGKVYLAPTDLPSAATFTADSWVLVSGGSTVVTPTNLAPTAAAGADQAVVAGTTVTLHGSGSDPEGTTLSYAWVQTSGPSVVLNGANTATPSFTADQGTTYAFSLTVTDGTLVSTPSVTRVVCTVPVPGSVRVGRIALRTAAALGSIRVGRVSLTPNAAGRTGGTLWWVGLSTSRSGQGASDASKQADMQIRTQEMADAANVPVSKIRSKLMWHTYTPGNQFSATGPKFSWPAANGYMGLVFNQSFNLSASSTELADWAKGSYDAQWQAFLDDLKAKYPNQKFVLIVNHEPENNGWNATQNGQWRQGTARFMKITADNNNPNIIYSVCHIPGTTSARSNWNPRAELVELAGSTKAAQAIMDKTLCGMDPYPEATNAGLGTLAQRCTEAMKDYRSYGWTRFYMPEVALYLWNTNTDAPYPATDAVQGQRFADELWTWARSVGMEGFNYYDVSIDTNPRSLTRQIDSPAELLAYSKIIREIAP